MPIDSIRVIDTHTGGEPTRIVLSGGPNLGDGPLSQRLDRFRGEFDGFRSAVVNEPRGSDVMVGALLVPPVNPRCVTGVIFFNNVGYLGMCGHGTIGVAVALAHTGAITVGRHALETPVGEVEFVLELDNRVTIENVPSHRLARQVAVEVPGFGSVRGDIAWGGNWFFLVDGGPCPLTLPNVDQLTDYTWAIRTALQRAGITGARGAEIDHIEIFGPAQSPENHSRNFVLCPGKAYDRSSCGTGTSAKLACLAADGKLAPGETWRQESVIGSLFEGRYQLRNQLVIPSITGQAWVNGEATLIVNHRDPFAWGIQQHGFQRSASDSQK